MNAPARPRYPEPLPPGQAAARGVGHDLGHALGTLQALLDGSGGGRPEDAEGAARWDAARHEVRYALDLLRELPASGATGASGAPSADGAASCPVGGVLRAAALAVAPSGRTIDVETGGRLEVAVGRTVLTRVVRNLLHNAVAATDARGSVLLRATAGEGLPVTGTTRADARLVTVEVHDDGPGPGRRGFSRHGGRGLEVVRSLVLPAGGWLVLGRSPLGGARAAVTLPGWSGGAG